MTRRNLLLLLLLALLAYLATGIYQVSPGELAVVRRFGQVDPEPRGPGLHVGLPWGFDRVDRVAVDEQRQLHVGYTDDQGDLPTAIPVGQALTGDNQMVNVRLTLAYRVDKNHLVDYVLHRDRVEDLLARAAESALAAVVAGETTDLILLGRAAALEAKLRAHLADRLAPYRLGLILDAVNVTLAQPPAELVEVFRDLNRARAQRDIALTDAQARKNADISLARQDARRQTALAQTNANTRLANARSEAAAFRSLVATFPRTDPAASAALLQLYLTEMHGILARMQVRTLSDKGVDQIVIVPLPGK
jgi:membrane protease subunit HflK